MIEQRYMGHDDCELMTKDEFMGVLYMVRSFRRQDMEWISDSRDGYDGQGHFTAYVQIDERMRGDKELEDYSNWGYSWNGCPDWPYEGGHDPGMCVVGWDYEHISDDYHTYEEIMEDIKKFISAYLCLMEGEPDD